MTRRTPLTPAQRAGLVAWHLAQGEGLTERQVRTLGKYGKRYNSHSLLARLQLVMALDCVDGETWAATFQQQAVTPATAQERAAVIAYLLATHGEVQTRTLALQLGVTRQEIYRLLDALSCCIPIYLENRSSGVWRVLSLRELDD